MLLRVNQIRCSRGLRPFVLSDTLFTAAREHSLEQQRCGYMGHDSPDPNRRTLVQRMQLAGYDGVMYGEVVAWGYKDTCAVVEGWMNSREHRAILVDGDLTEAAFSRVGDYWTGNFGTPRCGTYAPPSARTAAPQPCAPQAYAPQPCSPYGSPYAQPAVRAPLAQTPMAPSSRRYVPPPAVPVQAPRATRAPLRGG